MYPVNLPGGHSSLSNKGRRERSSISAVVSGFWISLMGILTHLVQLTKIQKEFSVILTNLAEYMYWHKV